MLGTGKTLSQALFPPKDGRPPKGRLFRNDLEVRPDGTRTLRFTDVTEASGLNANGYGMGLTAGDYDNDGCIDLYVTTLGRNQMFRNRCDGTFTDATNEAGLGRNTQYLGWGTLFLDVDNDGRPDIFIANGHVYPEVDGKGFRTSFREPKVLYWNAGNGRFIDVSQSAGPGIATPLNSHGVAAADFDNDGSVGILVNNSHDPPSLLKNLGEQGNWILLKLVGTRSNRDAIGTRVTLTADGRKQMQEVRSGGGYISQSDFRLHFGLGKAATVELLEIRWPSGAVQELKDLPANRVMTITESKDKTVPVRQNSR